MEYDIIEIGDARLRVLSELAEEAQEEGFGLVQRTLDEWDSGVNRFSKPGEVLWGAFIDERCIGICGLNQDPYIDDPDVGRVRHLYVSQPYRRNGIARDLVERVVERASGRFRVLRLSTNTPDAAAFYRALGFVESAGHKQTHVFGGQVCR